MKYIKEFLEIAPFSLAVWRSAEAAALAKSFNEFKPQPPYLDVGCGFGEFMSVFSPEFEGGRIDVGVDKSSREINLAFKKKVYKKLICCDARNLSERAGQFNLVTAVSVLEHIENVDKVFKEVARVLKPGGYFIFTVPTTKLNSPLWRFLLHPIFLHKSLYSPQGWSDLALNNGLEVKKVVGTVSTKQLMAFNYGLPLSLPTQLSRLFLKRRLPIAPRFRVNLLEKFIRNKLEGDVPTETNILVVAQKPL